MKKLLLFLISFTALLLIVSIVNESKALAADCTSPNSCMGHKDISGGQYCDRSGWAPTGDICTDNSKVCCKEVPNCATPNSCMGHKDISGGQYCDRSGWAPTGGICTDNSKVCCKEVPNCATPADCNHSMYGGTGAVCNPGYSPVEGYCSNINQKCCQPPPPAKACETTTAGKVCFSGQCNDKGECIGGLTTAACKQVSSGAYTYFRCKTALGTIYTGVEGFSQGILQLLLGLSGGILLVMIIINGYKIMTSQGDPEKIKDAREGIIAAIAGILLIIFSVSILQLITVDILGIPGFKK